MNPLKALSIAFGRLARLPHWPGDKVTVYGMKAKYVRGYCTDTGRLHNFCTVDVDGQHQLAPVEAVK